MMTIMEGGKAINPKALKEITEGVGIPGATTRRGAMDSGYLDYEEQWAQGEGSGLVTEQLMKRLDDAPKAAVDALDRNPNLPDRMLGLMERDAAFAKQYGGARKDIETARGIIAEGPGWVDRLKKAMKDGTILPAVGVPLLYPSLRPQDDEGGS